MAGKQTIRIIPRKLDVNTAPEQIGPDVARVLQNVDLDYQPGRMMRGPGYQHTQCAAVTSYDVTSNFVAVRRDCARILFYGDTGGVQQAQPPDGTVPCSGPLPDFDGGAGTGT